MTDLNRANSSNLDAVTAAGVATLASRDNPATYGVTLLANTTYYFPLGSPRAPVPAETALTAVHLRGAAALVISSASIEDCVFPAAVLPDGRGSVDVSDFDQGAGNWIPENPSNGAVSVVGTGWSPSAATAASLGSGAGGAMWHVGNLGSRRVRLKVVVGSVGGLARVGVHGKAAA
jgi:hypothetical protein